MGLKAGIWVKHNDKPLPSDPKDATATATDLVVKAFLAVNPNRETILEFTEI